MIVITCIAFQYRLHYVSTPQFIIMIFLITLLLFIYLQFTYLKLLEQEDERQTNTYLVMSSSSIAEKRFIDLFELLAELPRDRLDQTITFIKEEGMLSLFFIFSLIRGLSLPPHRQTW